MTYSPDDNKTVENINYDEVVLGKAGSIIEIRDVWMPRAQSWSPVYKFLTSSFSFDHYTSPRLPIDLGPFEISSIKTIPRVLRLTIKPIGDTKMYVPEELKSLTPFLTQIIEYERMINPNFVDCDIHLTTDYGFIEADQTQRFPGWHVDGLQGGKFKQKLMAEHSYVISTNNPTEFCLQPFFIKHYDEDITNFFKAFDQQASEENIYTAIPNHLYLMDAYMVHRTPKITESTYRGFIRITVANAPLPIEFNTLNPMLEQTRPVFKLDIRDWLRAPDAEINYEYFGLSNKGNDETLLVDTIEQTIQDIGEFENKPLTEGVRITIPDRKFPKVQPLSPTYSDMLEPFEPLKYTNPRLPIDLGIANIDSIRRCPNVLRMPLKWWDSDELMLPEEFTPIKALLERIFAYDKCHNPSFNSQVAHITHDTRVIEEGKTHRFPGFHGDDLQGGAFPEKEVVAHSYILTTNPGTEFCIQPFFVNHIDDTFERHFTEFDKQFKPENIYRSKADHIYLMDPYSVHRTPLEIGSNPRTFLRITFSTKNMLLPHNTLNPMFSGKQKEYDSLPMAHLDETHWTRASDKEIPYEMYGILKANS